MSVVTDRKIRLDCDTGGVNMMVRAGIEVSEQKFNCVENSASAPL